MVLWDERKQNILHEENPKKSVKNSRVAAVLSFCLIGLGQIYNGQIKKGLVLISSSGILMIYIITTVTYFAYILWVTPQEILRLVSWLILLAVSIIAVAIIGIYSIYDAYSGTNERE